MFKNITWSALLFLIPANTSIAQTLNNSNSLGRASSAALAYFQNVRNGDFDAFLNGIRPGRLSPELKLKAIAMLQKEDIVSPSAKDRAKLAALEPVLKYHERFSVVDLLVIRVGQPAVVLLAGAAVLLSVQALAMLTPEELQAVVAHELGHEYFWNEYEAAREN